MRKRMQGFVLGIIFTLLLSATAVFATLGSKNVSIFYRNIKMTLDGKTVTTTNEPFILNDRTYLPMRDVAESLGLSVDWDDANSTVILKTQSGDAVEVPDAEDNTQNDGSVQKPTDSEQSFAKEVFDLTNDFRAENGLAPFSWSDDLAKVAQAHSDDMAARNFFSHTNPDGLSPFNRMANAGIAYMAAAENIAYGQTTPEAVVTAWKNSAGHRANMLGNYKRLGVGYCANGNYWTQNFATFR